MNQISENLLTAIDIVVQERIKDLSYDKTELCTVIKQVGAKRYLVTNKGLSFEAIGDDYYSSGDQVYVTIPQNDSYANRIIIGKNIKEVKTLNSIALQDNLIIYGEVEKDEQKIINIETKETEIEFDLADFKNIPTHCDFSFNITSEAFAKNASFTLQIEFFNENNLVLFHTFTQKDILGNVELLSNAFQEKLFELVKMEELTKIKIILKEFQNFNQLEFSNFSFVFGDHIKNYSEPGLYINTINSLSYNANNNKKLIYCSILKKSENDILYKEINENSIRWQEYIITSYLTENMDTSWRDAIYDQSHHAFLFEVEKYPYKKIRVVNSETLQNSNILTFINTDKAAPEDIFDAETTIGTEYELIVEMNTNNNSTFPKNVFTKGYSEYTLYAELRDKYSNAEIVNSKNNSFSVSYELIESVNLRLSGNMISLMNSNNNARGILLAKGNYLNKTYIAYVSLGWRNSVNYTSFQGATVVIYNNNGAEPQWNQSPYRIYKNTIQQTGLTWSTNISDQIGYPTLSQDGNNILLKPYSTYIQNLEKDFYLKVTDANNTVIWIQPICLLKENYLSGEIGASQSFADLTNIFLSAIQQDSKGAINGVIVGEHSTNNQLGYYIINNGKIQSVLGNNKFLLMGETIKLINDANISDTDYVVPNKKYIDDKIAQVNPLDENTIKQLISTEVNSINIPTNDSITDLINQVLSNHGLI